MYKNVVIFNFSPRNDGNCAKIADSISNFHNRTNVFTYSITAENYLPCNGCDYECLKPGNNCPAQTAYSKEVMDAATAADLVYYVMPNFCGYPNANYFAFLERSVGYFAGDRQAMGKFRKLPKRFIIVSNSESEQFRSAMQQQTMDEPEILYLKTSKYNKVSIAGDLLESQEAVEDLRKFLAKDL